MKRHQFRGLTKFDVFSLIVENRWDLVVGVDQVALVFYFAA